MALSVEIDVKALAGVRQHVAAGGLDEALVIVPCLSGAGLVAGSFLNLAIAIDLAALQATNNDVGIMPKAVMKHLPHRPCQFFSISVGGEFTLLTVGDLPRLQRAAMRRGDNQRHIPRDILDVVAPPEIGLAGLIIGLAQAAGNGRKPYQASEGQAVRPAGISPGTGLHE